MIQHPPTQRMHQVTIHFLSRFLGRLPRLSHDNVVGIMRQDALADFWHDPHFLVLFGAGSARLSAACLALQPPQRRFWSRAAGVNERSHAIASPSPRRPFRWTQAPQTPRDGRGPETGSASRFRHSPPTMYRHASAVAGGIRREEVELIAAAFRLVVIVA